MEMLGNNPDYLYGLFLFVSSVLCFASCAECCVLLTLKKKKTTFFMIDFSQNVYQNFLKAEFTLRVTGLFCNSGLCSAQN